MLLLLWSDGNGSSSLVCVSLLAYGLRQNNRSYGGLVDDEFNVIMCNYDSVSW